MEKCTLMLYGRTIKVDADQVDLHIQKDAQVRMASLLQNRSKTEPLSEGEKTLLDKCMRKIIRLNKRIRQNVIVVN